MRLRCGIFIVLSALLPAVVHASVLVSAKEYLAQRKKLVTQIEIARLKSSPSSYIGKVFEIRGAIAGFSRNQSGCCLIINTPEHGSFLVGVDSIPVESPGADIACLVRIGPGSAYSLSDLQLVACCYEAFVKPSPPPPAKTVPEPRPRVQDPTSRGTMSSEELVTAYRRAVKGFNSKLTDSQADTIARSVLGFSFHYKVDPRLVCAVILAESHFRVNATSSAGAQGLGQLMPSTAAGLGVNNAYDPVENVYGSVRYIKSMLDRMSGNKHWNELTWYDLALALAAYNAGPGAVKKHGGVPPYRETQSYVRKVVSIYKQLCGVG